jgi:hypothetical protein
MPKTKLKFKGDTFNSKVTIYQKQKFIDRVLSSFPEKEIMIEVTEYEAQKSLNQLGYYFGAIVPTYKALLREFGDICTMDEARWKLEKQSPALEEINTRTWNKKKVLGQLSVLKSKNKTTQTIIEKCGAIEPVNDAGSLVFHTDDDDVLGALIRAGGSYMEYDCAVGFKPYIEKSVKRVSSATKLVMSEHIEWCVNQIAIWSDGFFIVQTPEEYYGGE